jgi:hypothetical protein
VKTQRFVLDDLAIGVDHEVGLGVGRGGPILALGGVVVHRREGRRPRTPVRLCRLMSFRACVYRRGIIVEASSPRGGGGFASFPGSGEK